MRASTEMKPTVVSGVMLIAASLAAWILAVRRGEKIEQWIAAREYSDLVELLVKGSARVLFPVLMALGIYLVVGTPLRGNWSQPEGLSLTFSLMALLLGVALMFFSRRIQAYSVDHACRAWYLFESERRFVMSPIYPWLLRVVGMVFGSAGAFGLLFGRTR